jgi:hypothetical protein
MKALRDTMNQQKICAKALDCDPLRGHKKSHGGDKRPTGRRNDR